MKWYILIPISFILSSCSAQWHLSKAVKKNPAILQKDTITVVDTIVTQPVALTDTVVLRHMDTIVVHKDRLKVKITRSFDTIRVDAICESDTIVNVVEVPYEKIVYVEREKIGNKITKWLLALAVFVLLLVSLKTVLAK
jgi:hypothetical protein